MDHSGYPHTQEWGLIHTWNGTHNAILAPLFLRKRNISTTWRCTLTLATDSNETHVPISAEYEDLVAALEVIAPHRVRPTVRDMSAQDSAAQYVCNGRSKITITVDSGFLNGISASTLPIGDSQAASESCNQYVDGHQITETSITLLNSDCESGSQDARCLYESQADR